MTWYAVEEIDEAFEEMKELLLPLDLGTWARLLLIVMLTGSGVSMPNFPSVPGNSGTSYQETDNALGDQMPTQSVESQVPDIPSTALATSSPTSLWVIIGVVILGLIVAIIYLSSVFEFIFYQSLLDRDVSIRNNFREHKGRGFSYFLFRIVTGLFTLALVALSVLLITESPLAGILLVMLLMLGLIPFMIFLGLTHNFVLLKMIEDSKGLIEAWKDLYPVLKSQWQEVLVYVVVRFVIKMIVGIASLIWVLIALLIVIIPFSIAGIIAYIVWQPLIWVVVATGLLTLFIAIMLVQVPIQSYLYYYAILVYHDLTS